MPVDRPFVEPFQSPATPPNPSLVTLVPDSRSRLIVDWAPAAFAAVRGRMRGRSKETQRREAPGANAA